MCKVLSNVSGRLNKFTIGTLVLLASATATLAAPPTPPDMGAIQFPISLTSIASTVALAGGALLIAYFGIKIGFAFVKKMLSRVQKAV